MAILDITFAHLRRPRWTPTLTDTLEVIAGSPHLRLELIGTQLDHFVLLSSFIAIQCRPRAPDGTCSLCAHGAASDHSTRQTPDMSNMRLTSCAYGLSEFAIQRGSSNYLCLADLRLQCPSCSEATIGVVRPTYLCAMIMVSRCAMKH
jgi:hypothetical protein